MRQMNATKKGLLIALAIIVVSLLLFYVFHLPENGKSQYVILVTFIIGMLWTMVDFHIKQKITPRFKEYFSEGFKAFIVVTLLMVLYSFIFYKLNPQIMEKGIEENNILIAKQGSRTPAEIIENANKLRTIFIPMMLFITTMKFLILGTLITVVSAGFMSQKTVTAK
jgi:hypothetical protein